MEEIPPENVVEEKRLVPFNSYPFQTKVWDSADPTAGITQNSMP